MLSTAVLILDLSQVTPKRPRNQMWKKVKMPVLGKLQAGIYEDLDELANLLPYAADDTWTD